MFPKQIDSKDGGSERDLWGRFDEDSHRDRKRGESIK